MIRLIAEAMGSTESSVADGFLRQKADLNIRAALAIITRRQLKREDAKYLDMGPGAG
jgi:hypothetical protein